VRSTVFTASSTVPYAITYPSCGITAFSLLAAHLGLEDTRKLTQNRNQISTNNDTRLSVTYTRFTLTSHAQMGQEFGG